MNDRTKKILLLVGFVASIFAIGFAIYFMFFRSTTEQQEQIQTTEIPSSTGGLIPSEKGTPGGVTPTSESETGVLPKASEIALGGITQTTTLTTSAISNSTLSADGQNVNFYNTSDNRFYSIDKNGEVVRLSDKTFPEIENATWNRDAKKAVLEFPDGSNIVYDFDQETQVTLPKHWEDFSFSPTSDQLEAKSIGLDPNNRWLVISNDSGSNVIPIQELGENGDKVQISWSPNDQVVGFADTSSIVGEPLSGFDRKVIYPIGKNKENFKGLVVEGSDFKPLWSTDGKQLLYSVYGDYSNQKPLLWVVNATASSMGENRHSLGLNTWVDKCTWTSSVVVYCAVPQNLPDNAGLQPSLYASYPDSIYKIDLTTNQNTLIAIPSEDKTMKNLSVSKDGALLYFTNAVTGQLELIKLK